jgi:hypothetical protein
MRSRVFVAVSLGFWLVAVTGSQAAPSNGRDSMERLIQGAYFSDACRRGAEALGIAGASDANSLFMAFIAIRARVGVAHKADPRRDGCEEPVILLINLLRLNGVDAELVLASKETAAVDGAPSGTTDRVVVYAPSLDRYFDPASPLSEQAVLNWIIAERATRTHILGPSLAGDARGGCRSTCMNVYGPRSQSSVRVRTQAIRGH